MKLDYLKELGVETLWLSPIFESPQADHGYDISNFTSINPEYGTMSDVEELIKCVHERGMKIIFDMVMNHTSNEHKWFRDSIQRKNGKDDWYIWQDGGKMLGCLPTTPNNWRSMLGPNGWIYNAERKQYYYASFLSFQPDLNYRNPEVKKAMLDIVKFWIEKDIDGFRLDIFNCIYKDETFEDNPRSWKVIPTHEDVNGFFQMKIKNINHPDTVQFAKELRNFVDGQTKIKKNRFLLGEIMGRPETLKAFVGTGKQPGLNMVFMFEMLNFYFSASHFRSLIEKFENEYPAPHYSPVLVYSNHDIRRMFFRIGGSVKKAKVLAALQMTMRGVPCIYYGEEIGMTEGKIALKDAQDPVTKIFSACVPQFLYDSGLLNDISMNRDNCRTPMQWSSNSNGGFSACTKDDDKISVVGLDSDEFWLPLNSDTFNGVNVKAQLADEASLLQMYRNLLKLRKVESALNSGELRIPENTRKLKDVLSYERIDPTSKSHVLVFLNFSGSGKDIDASLLPSKTLTLALSEGESTSVVGGRLHLSPFGIAILKIA
eukprot:CAMPEP_0184016054 /NCGR_PEP_ID=MMETSP0954-20121128/6700_1 /TAXON_ID=627963 /ORGANISM="Aplanochytrium sp, Strain PBS07" /LENGTH=542 /DNA_ID=CAMNT_0026297001 /DNA_START=299 /DNA_END=1927 /DNA_ORIENTATION=+